MPKNQNGRNLGQVPIEPKIKISEASAKYIPLDPEFYADHYSQKDYIYLEK